MGRGAQKKVSKRAKRHMDEAGEIVASFCEEFHPARVEPTADEMAAFWDRCYGFKSAHLSAAIVDQLSLQNGAEWQPRLRALCLLEQCFDENSKAPRLVAMKVFDESEEVLQYLASQVTQCADKANQVLRKCAAPAPIPPIVIAKPPVAVTDTDALSKSLLFSLSILSLGVVMSMCEGSEEGKIQNARHSSVTWVSNLPR